MEAIGTSFHYPEDEINSVRRSVDDLSHLSEIFWHIESSTDFWKAVHKTLDSLKRMMQFENGIVYIYNSDKHAFDWQRSGDISQTVIRDLQNRLFETLFHYVISDKRPLILDYSLQEIADGQNPMEPGHGSCLAVPVIENKQAIGILILEHRIPRGFTQSDLHVAMLYGNHIGFSYYRLHHPVSEESMAHRYHNLFERINVPLFYCTAEGSLQYANQSFLDLMELRDIQEAVEIELFNRIEFVQHRETSFLELIRRCGFFKNIEAQIERYDGQRIMVLISIIPLRDENRNVIGFEGVIRDISDKRDLEAQLLQAQKLGALGSLTGGIAHDFNNLISGIMGCASLLLTEVSETHPFYNDILTIMNASRRAADLTGQLLSFTRKHQYEIKNFCTHTLVREVVGLLSHTLPKNIQIVTEIEPEVYCLHVDPTQMEQALMNICINARDAMPQGGVLTIQAQNIFLDSRARQITKTLEAGPYVLFRIKDTGSGMDKELQNRIFEPFFTTKSANKGSGLGLSIVADIVQKHHGCVSVQSELGQGSMFEMLIPAGLTEEEKERMTNDEIVLTGGNETLLLVDDEEVIRRMTRRMLEKFGYKVLLAQDGVEAVEIFRDQKVDLVIIDMIMPKLDGFRTLQQMKTINPDTKAVLFTGNVTVEGRQKCLDAGFYDLVTKPFETRGFLQTVRHVLDQCVDS